MLGELGTSRAWEGAAAGWAQVAIGGRHQHLINGQNAQLPRLCDVRIPDVDVVYVAPFALNEDVSHYFSKVLEIGGVPISLNLLATAC